jgi:AraC-like DNA-binding protein
MQVTTLPKDLKINTSGGLQLFDYRTKENILKAKIDLSKNTISFLRAGTKEVVGDDKTVRIDSGSFIVMKAGNCLMTEKVSAANRIYQSILLFFTDEEALSFLEKHKLYSPGQTSRKSFYTFKYDDFIIHFVEGLEKILLLPQAAQQQLLKTKFEEIMLYLSYQDASSFLNGLVQDVDDKVNHLSSVVDSNKHNRLSLAELAFLCNMSVSTFKRAFFKAYQETPMKWFNEQRLNHAAFVLKTKRQRPIELYEDAGYKDFSNFVQAFKKKFGVTPKQYQTRG